VLKPKIPHVRAPEGEVAEPEAAAIPPVQRRAFKIGVVGVAAAVVLVLAGGAFFAFRFWSKSAPPPPPAVVKKNSPPATAATPPVAQPPAQKPEQAPTGAVSMPGKMVEKAGTAVAVHDAGEKAQTEIMGPPPAAVLPPVAAPKATNAATTTIAPGVQATTSESVLAIDASPAFRTWAANLNISSVFPNAGRATINGRVVHVGQMVDEGAGIMLESINTQPREMVFKDKSGAKVSRRYF
jgi:hypothetical protein